MRSNKGLTMIELILTGFLLALMMPIILSIFVNGLEFLNTTGKQALQQQKANEAVQLIKKDIEEAAAVQLMSDRKLHLTLSSGEERYWFFNDTAHSLQFSRDDVPANYVSQVEGLDTSTFQINQGRLILSVKPQNTNRGKHQARNMESPMITEFSIRYK